MTVQYVQKGGTVVPQRVHTVVISAQHDDGVSLAEQKKVLQEQVVKAVVPSKYLDENTVYHLQPSGRFVIGGPQVKASVWRRRHGGLSGAGAFRVSNPECLCLLGRRWHDRPEDHR